MKIIKISALVLISLLHTQLQAGINGETYHSRANCFNNESISWDATKSHYYWVNSDHISLRTGETIHTIATGWVKTWRCAAVHWGEGTETKSWVVHGVHWEQDKYGATILAAVETVDNCSIYDGWWDRH